MYNAGARTGIPVLDTALTQGIPRNSLVILYGEGGTGKTVIMANIAYNFMKAGEPCVYVSLDDDPASLIQVFSSFQWDVTEYIEKGMFKVIDCFSFRITPPRKPPAYVYSVLPPKEPHRILEALVTLMNDMKMEGRGVVLMDSLNEVFTQTEIMTALEFLKTLRAVGPKTRNALMFATMHAAGKSIEELIQTIEYSVDGLIEFKYEPSLQQLGIPVKQFLIKKMRGVSHYAANVPYAITSEGVRPVDPRKLSTILKSIYPTSSEPVQSRSTLEPS